MRNRVDMICDANNFAETISITSNKILELYEELAELYPIYEEILDEWKETMFSLNISRNWSYSDYSELSDLKLEEKCKEYIEVLKILEERVEGLEKFLDKIE